ncbi:GGDEF domain-containing protein [Starkeya koreensis]|uniref:diguanylate cyclase n=1 Tax=Ancylobacter koreensis TaxID=266121 RepID=A0ABT0DN57_9HYPH|nr:GGDEF domain-containing protein [Ancylobacter koreensis]MCK0208722.1 GGDEF domain-containing protein [Ancylobacter koreensis]
MLLDYVTLLTAVGISAACLSITIFMGWLMAPRDSYLLACSAGGAVAGLGLLVYGFYVANPLPVFGIAAFAVIIAGLALLVGAGHCFRTDRPARPLVIGLTLGGWALALPGLAMGYTGLGFVPINLVVGGLLLLTAAQYWAARKQAPYAIATLCGLYTLTGLSFFVCAADLLRDGRAVLDGAPQGWAEDLSLLVMIACIPGIGAVTLALNQARIARRHQLEAMTDSLTGLLNRRALFDAADGLSTSGGTAVIVFDIDRFKAINDRHGHAAGDRAIIAFARAMTRHAPPPAIAARLGGEEFAIVLPVATADSALRIADTIRHRFRESIRDFAIEGMEGSVSAGIAFVRAARIKALSFEQALNEADAALYAAKNAGRNRVIMADPRLASDRGSRRAF